MNKALYDFVYGIEEKETPNLDQVDERYFKLIDKIINVLMILNSIIYLILSIFIFIIVSESKFTNMQVIIYFILMCIIIYLINAPFSLAFRFDKIIYPYMVKKNKKAYEENQNLLPEYYYIMGWVKFKEEVNNKEKVDFWNSIDVMNLTPTQRKHFNRILKKEIKN